MNKLEQPFTNHTFIVVTPDGIETIPGRNLRGLAILMYKRTKTVGASLYTTASGSTELAEVGYAHTLESLEEGRHFHRTDLTLTNNPDVWTTVHWQDARPHEVTLRPAQKMGTPHGLYQAVCNCGAYESKATSEGAARHAGAQHVRDRNEQETYQ